MNRDHETNRKQWNILTDAHFSHPGYRVKEFLAGEIKLHSLEREEIGDEVAGKSLLHLQCHFGMDTLSWARLGATVTGIDISDRSIERARELAQATGIDARFHRSDIYDLPDVLKEQFDIVYASYGVLWWLSDIKRWGEIVAQYVKPGGFFYIAEIHPVLNLLDAEKNIFEPYFHQGTEKYYDETDYCDKDTKVEEEIGWRWTLGDIISSLAAAGLHIEFLHEYPFCVYDKWPTFVKQEGWYYYPDRKNEPPMTFSLKAKKIL